MARWGKTDFRELKALSERLDKLSKKDFDAFCLAMAKEMGEALRRKVIHRTPVVYGTLRGAWALLPPKRAAGGYEIELVNNLQYASYVEYGHRQQPGRFVPGEWKDDHFEYDPNAEGGIVLKDTWVKGRFMLTISAEELWAQAPKVLEKKLYQFLKGCFDAQ